MRVAIDEAPRRLSLRSLALDNGLSRVTLAHRLFFMGYNGSRIAGNVTPSSLLRLVLPPSRPPFASVVSCPSRHSMRRAMSYNLKNQLWNSRLGIRFSPKRDPRPLYPQLDVARFLQNSSLNSNGNPGEGELISDRRASGNLLSDLQETRIATISLTQQSAAVPKAGPEELAEEDVAAKEEIVEPPWTPLNFSISSELFHAARASPAGSAGSFWSHTMYQSATDNGWIQKVKIHYCKNRHSMEYVCKRYFLGQSVLGFDLEWLSYASRSDGPRENVSLIQIASPDHVGLFHTALFPKDDDFVAPTFRKIMEDPDVSKAGVQIQGDCTRLKNYLGVSTRGIFELSHLYKVVKFWPERRADLINRVTVALSIQALEHLRLPLYKGPSVRSSNWMKPLDARQLEYSASDAYAGVQLYYVLEAKRKALDPCPPRPHHAELGLPLPLPEPPADKETPKRKSSRPSKPKAPKPPPPPSPGGEPKKPLPSQGGKPTRDPRITAAELEMSRYRSSRKPSASAPSTALRAYFIWHGNSDLKPVDIAKLLRDPPLQTHTVVIYILDAIVADKLPYSTRRLKNEVLSLVHPNFLLNGGKYESLAQD